MSVHNFQYTNTPILRIQTQPPKSPLEMKYKSLNKDSCTLTKQDVLVSLLIEVPEQHILERGPALSDLRDNALDLLEVVPHALHVIAHLTGQPLELLILEILKKS